MERQLEETEQRLQNSKMGEEKLRKRCEETREADNCKWQKMLQS